MCSIFSKEYADNYTIQDIEAIFSSDMNQVTVTEAELNELLTLFQGLAKGEYKTNKEFQASMPMSVKARHKKVTLISAYRKLIRDKRMARAPNLEKHLRVKGSRGDSGIVSITTMMSGRQFGISQDAIKRGGCPNDCYYCPLERDSAGNITQPRSYLSS